jgi:hypothetical protein
MVYAVNFANKKLDFLPIFLNPSSRRSNNGRVSKYVHYQTRQSAVQKLVYKYNMHFEERESTEGKALGILKKYSKTNFLLLISMTCSCSTRRVQEILNTIIFSTNQYCGHKLCFI